MIKTELYVETLSENDHFKESFSLFGFIRV